VVAVLYEGRTAAEVIPALMRREAKPELHGIAREAMPDEHGIAQD
jgi:hypothetical protein